MILSPTTTELIRHLNVGSAAQLRSRLIEFLQNERMRQMTRCTTAEISPDLYRAQGAHSTLLDLETILTATPSKIQHENEKEAPPTQYPGGPY